VTPTYLVIDLLSWDYIIS